jgi:hypothetical protein
LIKERVKGAETSYVTRQDLTRIIQGRGVWSLFRTLVAAWSPKCRIDFFTPRNKRDETGLGTKIIKDVVDAHGGHIYVESELAVGTPFFLHLSIHPPPPRR